MRFFFIVCGFGLSVAAINILTPAISPKHLSGTPFHPVSDRTESDHRDWATNKVLKNAQPNLEFSRASTTVVGNTNKLSPVFDVTFSNSPHEPLVGSLTFEPGLQD